MTEERQIEDFNLKDCFIYTLGMFESDPYGFVDDDQNSLDEKEQDVIKMLKRMKHIWETELKETAPFKDVVVDAGWHNPNRLIKICEMRGLVL
jgi:hypothetical protein